MSRSRRRASRALIAFLGICVVIGLVYHLRQPGKVDAVRNPVAAQSDSAKPAVDPELYEPGNTLKPAIPAIVHTLPVANPEPTPIVETQPTTRPIAFAAPLDPPTTSTQTLNDAKVKLSSGDLLGSRKLLNDALLSGVMSKQDIEATKAMLADINKTVIFGPKRFADDPFGGTYSVVGGDKLTKIATASDITWEFLCRVNNMSDPRKLHAGQTLKLIKGPFHAVVTKSSFKMDLYLGNPGDKGSVFVASYGVGLGKDDSTPTGTWLVEPHKKIKNPTYFSPRGEGVIAADDPKNPLGEFWIGLTGIDGHAVGKSSYGIHGTIEPESIGTMASMGCIRMRNEDVAVVFEMLVEGKSTIVVKE